MMNTVNAIFGLIGLSLALTSSAAAQSDPRMVPDTPENHWIYEAISDLKSQGVLVGYPDGLGTRINGESRYEKAVEVNAAWIRFHRILSSLKALNEGMALGDTSVLKDQVYFWTLDSFDKFEKTAKEDLKLLRLANVRISAELHRLIAFFDPELKGLGCEPEQMSSQLTRDTAFLASLKLAKPGQARKQFTDVRTNHWAAEAVLNLRSLGILHGYEDGTFRG